MHTRRAVFASGSRISMNVLHVIPSFYPATRFGGPVYSSFGLCSQLAEIEGVEVRVLTTDTAGSSRRDRLSTRGTHSYGEHFEVHYARKLLGVDFSVELLQKLWDRVSWADVVHVTGVYSSPTIPALAICGLLKKPVVWSPRGSLQRWEGTRRAFPKLLWEAVCNVLLRRTRATLHVTSDEEAQASSQRLHRASTSVIRNGVDVPSQLPQRDWRPAGVLRAMYVGRLHPIKGIENLLDALALGPRGHVSLKVFGEGEGTYRESLERKAAALGLGGRVTFCGHLADAAKSCAFSEADVCIVPSFSENFGMVVAEALAHGVPVIASTKTPWAAMVDHQCGMWVDNSAASLSQALARMQDEALQDMGNRGRAWMQREFSWSSVALQMYSLYREMCTAQRRA